jgi:peptidoglycan/xylan/chitin deacetylase (PgdA/CDA1 family)
MLNCAKGILAAAALVLSQNAVAPGEVLAAESAPRVRVTTWFHDAKTALSLSFDDWSPDHWSRGMSLWQEFGYRVTIGFTMAKLNKHPDGIAHLQRAFDAGDEIANHTALHQNFESLTQGQIRYDLGQCNDFLLSNIQGLKHINTVIYPEEYFNDDTIRTIEEMGYLFARSGPQGINDIVMLNDSLRPPFLHLFSWCNQNSLSLQYWNDAVDWSVNKSGWLIEQCHGIGSVGESNVGWSPRPLEEYRAHFEHIRSFGDKIWVAPIGDVGRYVIERNACKPVVRSNDSDSMTFELQSDLDYDRFNVPLTVGVELPALWIRASALQAAKELDCTYTTDGWVQFDVVPGAGPVTVSRRSVASRGDD